MKYVYTYKDNIVALFEKVVNDLKLIVENEDFEYIYTTFTYFFEVGATSSREEFMNAVKCKLSNSGKKKIVTIADQFRAEGRKQGMQQGVQQGVQQGKQQGVQQGMREEKTRIARNLLIKNTISLEEIADITGLSINTIKALKRKSHL